MFNFISVLIKLYSLYLFYFSAEYASLLGSGDLNEKSSLNFVPSDQEFPLILAKICFHLHFRGRFAQYSFFMEFNISKHVAPYS